MRDLLTDVMVNTDKFYQGHILDKEFLKEILKDIDIVYHLAGITDVANTKKESNSQGYQWFLKFKI